MKEHLNAIIIACAIIFGFFFQSYLNRYTYTPALQLYDESLMVDNWTGKMYSSIEQGKWKDISIKNPSKEISKTFSNTDTNQFIENYFKKYDKVQDIYYDRHKNIEFMNIIIKLDTVLNMKDSVDYYTKELDEWKNVAAIAINSKKITIDSLISAARIELDSLNNIEIRNKPSKPEQFDILKETKPTSIDTAKNN